MFVSYWAQKRSLLKHPMGQSLDDMLYDTDRELDLIHVN